MSVQKDIIFLYTVNFPYGNSEPYLHNELPYLSKHFKKVVIVPLLEERGNMELPPNVEVRYLSEIRPLLNRKAHFTKNLWCISKILLNEFLNCGPKFYFLKKLHYYFSELLNAIELSEKILIIAGPEKDRILHYSFWMNNWALALAYLKMKGRINDFVFRVHGFDLYKERWPNNYIPFRHMMYKYCTNIFPVSELGLNYIRSNFTFSEKAKRFYLGTFDHGINPYKNDEYVIVSCSNFAPLKRLHLLVEALSNAKFPITWIHFGDGYSYIQEKLKVEVKNFPISVKVKFAGHVTQKELFEFYRNNPVTCFINVSETEGLPVSIMEAISFGIPIIATNVGGIPEIVNEKTGILIDKNIKGNELLEVIKSFPSNSLNNLKARDIVKNQWKSRFDAEVNYKEFSNYLLSIVTSERLYQQCVNCIMDTDDDKEIIFDQEGVCSYCNYYEELKDRVLLKEPARTQKLNSIIGSIKEAGKNTEYDCIIGVSGGVDSTYLAYFVKELGLRPLAVHLDYGWNSELAVKNIENVLKILGIELYTYVVDWEEIKDLQRAFLKASVVDIELINDFAIAASLYNTATKFKIRHVIHGWNVVTEGGLLPKGWTWSKYDQMNIFSIHKLYGKRRLVTYPKLSAFKKLYLERVKKLEVFGILNYTDFNKKRVKEILEDKLGWRDYGGKHFESIFTRFYQGYILPTKFKIDKRKFHLSVLICSGQIDRKEALNELKKDYYPEELMKSDKEFVLKKLDFSEMEFDKIMNESPVSHLNYRSYQKKVYPWITMIMIFLSKLKKLNK